VLTGRIHGWCGLSACEDGPRSQDLEVGGRGNLGMEVPQRGPGAEPLVRGSGGKAPENSQHITDIGCQTMNNYVYLAIVHEPPIKHEKNLGCYACLFVELSNNRNTSI